MTTPPETCEGYCRACGSHYPGMTTPPDDHPSLTTPPPTVVTTTTPPPLLKPVLVDTEAAALYAGRPPRTIYRWATERRLTRHGTPGKGNARWNLREIPGWNPSSGRPKPPPPPVL